MARHTNTAALTFAACDILECVGRLNEHELWEGDPANRKYIDETMMKAATRIANWLGCDLVKRTEQKEAA